jgi:hypothetical protein
MIRKSILFALVTMMISALAITALAQKKSSPNVKSTQLAEMTILDVTKRGVGQSVQVDAKMKVVLPAGARLQMVEWVLTTTNSDGSTSRGTKTWNAANAGNQQTLTCTIDLPMANGIIAERFTLTAKANFLHEGVAQKANTSKSGRFAR